jgi:PAS domain-containing protein
MKSSPASSPGTTGSIWKTGDRVIASCYAAINGGATSLSEGYRFRRADGTYADVVDRGYIVRKVRGQALRLIGAMTDLSALRKEHAALQVSEARVRGVGFGAGCHRGNG